MSGWPIQGPVFLMRGDENPAEIPGNFSVARGVSRHRFRSGGQIHHRCRGGPCAPTSRATSKCVRRAGAAVGLGFGSSPDQWRCIKAATIS
jgi:hypothetical protein